MFNFKNKTSRVIISLVALGCFLWIGKDYLGQLEKIAQANWAAVCLAGLIHIAILWMQSLTIKWGLDTVNQPINTRESFVLFSLASYANLLIPKSGIGTTAAYLKSRRKTPISEFGSIVMFNIALFVMACSAFGCAVLLIDWVTTREIPALWMAFGIPLLFLISLLSVSVRWSMPNWYQYPGRAFLERFLKANNLLVGSTGLLKIGGMHFVLVLMRAIRLYVAFFAMGLDVAFLPVLLTSILGDLAFVVAVTPSAIGFREAAVGLVAAKLGVSIPLALSAAILDRLVFTLATVLLAQFLILFVVGKSTQEPETNLRANQSEALPR